MKVTGLPTRPERFEFAALLNDANVTGLDRERILSMFGRVAAERDEAVRQLTVMRRTLESVQYTLRRNRQAEVSRRLLRWLDTPIEDRGAACE